MAAPPPPAERLLWRLQRFGRTVVAVEQVHPEGANFVVLMEPRTPAAPDVRMARVVRFADLRTLETESENTRRAFMARGWLSVE